MFESFYCLRHSPFSRDIPSSELYASVILEETLGRLEYAAERQWFAVVTGDCGTGKTTAIRLFAEVWDVAKYKVLYLSDSKLTPISTSSFSNSSAVSRSSIAATPSGSCIGRLNSCAAFIGCSRSTKPTCSTVRC